MPKSKVIVDVANGDVTLEQSLRRLEVLAHDVKTMNLSDGLSANSTAMVRIPYLIIGFSRV